MDSADGHHQPRRRGATRHGLAPASPTTTTGGDGRPVAAAVALALSWALALAAVVLWWLNSPDWSEDQWYFVVDLMDALVYGSVAWVVLSRRSHPVGWILALTAVGGGLAAASFQWSVRLADHPDLPALAPLSSAQQWGWVPGTLALVTVVPWLVRDEPLDARARLAVVLGAGLTASMVLARVTDPYPWPDGPANTPFPIHDQTWVDLIMDVFRWQMGALVALGLLAAADVARRWRGRPAEQRRGLGWLAIGATLLTLAFLPLAVTVEVAEVLPLWLTPVLHLSSQLFFPAAVLVAVLRQRLWGLDLVVSRALVWSLLTAGVVAAYVGLVAGLTPLLASEDAPEVLATALVAAGFQPARAWVQRRVDHLVRGDGSGPLGAVRQVGRHLGAAGSADDLLAGVVANIAASLRLGSVAIGTATPAEPADGDPAHDRHDGSGGGDSNGNRSEVSGAAAGGDTIVRVGEPIGPTTEVALVHQQVAVGRLVVTARPGERLDGHARASLDELAPVVAATVHLAATTRALSRSRRRLAEARDEERRALRRELHDGLGPALAGIGLGLQAARNQLATQPATAAALLDRLAAEVEVRVEEVRGLARGLLPPALGDAGLASALGELAERYAVTGLDVHLDLTTDLDLLPPVVANGVYAIVSEAVRNVHRHADTPACVVRVAITAGDLVVVVADEGTGLAADTRSGVGLVSMRERAEGLGGTFTITRTGPAAVAPAGTRVEIRIPWIGVEVAP